MKFYEEAELEIIRFYASDVIRTSDDEIGGEEITPGEGEGGFGPGE